MRITSGNKPTEETLKVKPISSYGLIDEKPSPVPPESEERMRLTAYPDGKVIIDGKEIAPNDYKGFIEASAIFERAADLYASRGGFSESGTKLDEIRKKRNILH